MRLTSFTLENYGNFGRLHLALDPELGHLNLVVAPNGGGKTVLRQAFHDLLFGIPGQTKMAFLHGYQGMRLSAEGIDASGGAFTFGRRKGIGNTLVDGAGNSVDPRLLAPRSARSTKRYSSGCLRSTASCCARARRRCSIRGANWSRHC